MSKGYLVQKRIRGRLYLYRQRSWREAGKVRTECICLGPISDTTQSASKPNPREFSNPFLDGNTTNTSNTFGNPFVQRTNENEPAISSDEYLSELKALAEQAYERNVAAGIIKPKRRENSERNTTKRLPSNTALTGSLQGYKISEVALAREFSHLVASLNALGLDTSKMPKIRISKGKKAGWHKSWLGSRIYVVTLPDQGGRTKFKKVYREALASCFLEELRRQDKAKYKSLVRSAPRLSFNKGKLVREALVSIIQHGNKEARNRFIKLSRFKKQKEKKQRGDVGKATLKTLKGMGISWG